MTTGVIVTTSIAPGPGSADSDVAGTYFAVGQAERGDTTAATLVRSFGEFLDRFGDRVTYGRLYDDLQAYFGEAGGAGRAYIARVVGPAATLGTLTLKDRAGAPVDTLRIDAANQGAWSSRVKVEVRDGLIDNTFTLVVTYDGNVVEQYNNLASPDAAVRATGNSSYIRAVNLGSATVAPANNPAVAAATALTAGADDHAAVDSAALIGALDRFTADLGPGIVAIPGQPETVAGSLAAHCSTHRRIGVLAPAAGTSVASATAAARTLRSTTGAQYLGMTYPWVVVSDGAGGTRTISPEGFTAGVRARTAAKVGVWQAPAGELGRAEYILGVETTLTQDEVDTLSDSAVNPIRVIVGSPRLYGWRSLSGDEANWRFLSYADLVNVVAWDCEQALERFVFSAIDSKGHLFSQVGAALTDVVDPIAAAGGLYARVDQAGGQADPGYSIDLGASVNTPDSVAAGQVNAVVGIRPSPVGELIKVQLVKAALAVAF